MCSYPGVRPAFHILPSLTLAFGSAVLVLMFGRLDYSRSLLLVSFIASNAWFYLVYYKVRRQRVMTIGVVPCGDVNGMLDLPGIRCIMLSDPSARPSHLDAVVADLRASIPPRWERFLADEALKGTLVLHKKQILESLTGQVEIEHLSENNFGSLIPGIMYGKIKRILDFITALVLIPLLAPMMIMIGLAIRFDSSGPAIFRQRRIGFRGREFTIFKFRTMTATQASGSDRIASITQARDNRVTRIGAFLRRSRLDELPQILNVLLGHMSWIGPRPEAVALSHWYEAELPFYRYRHVVRPGITGWAQVKQGHVAEVNDVRHKLHFDFYYIKNFSLWLDILIAVSTVRTVLFGLGAR
jgi:lipopolysaccharide/colanic/teichoic acid biosynthesis glycosyltransferase